MEKTNTMLRWIWLLFTLGAGSANLINPNGGARPGGAFGRGGNSFEQDLAAVFNRVAHGSTSAPNTNSTSTSSTTTTTPVPSPAASTTTFSPSLSYVPDPPDFVNRPRFKPPLPPEYNNPFADKGILRGSQSEGPATGVNRRQQVLPPKPPIRPMPDIQERIPIRPPDLPANVDRKKQLNTPSNPDPTSNEIRNETYPSESPSGPVLNSDPSLTRIMSEQHKPHEDRPADKSQKHQNSSSSSRVHLDLVNKDSMIDVQAPTTSEPSKDESPNVVTESPPREAPENWPKQIGILVWDVVTYTLASLFALLALYCFLVSPFRATDSLISHGSYCFLHLFLFVIGVSRSGFLFYDAYNIRGTFIPILECIALDMAFPCLFAAFVILFFSIAHMTKVQLCHSTFQSPTFLSLVVILNMLLFGLLEWAAQILDLIDFMISALRALPLLSLILASLSFSIAFRCIYRAARRLQGDVLRANFAKMGALPRRPQLKLASRLILAAALLILVLCPLHIYVLFSVIFNGRDLTFWCCQLGARVLELCVACLLVSVAWLRRSEVPNNSRRLCCCYGGTDNKSVDDLFPAICSKNNAIHNYSLHTGKAVYEHANTLKPIYPRTVATASLKRPTKSGTMPSQRQHRTSQQLSKPSDPMLYPEEVHYRTSEEAYSRTANRHEALTAFNISEDCYQQVNNRRSDSGSSLSDVRAEKPSRRPHHRSRGHLQPPMRQCYQQQKSLLDPPDSPSNLSSPSGGSSSDLSESDLTSGGYERVRVANHNRKNVRAAKYQATS